jgi:hypothetical protein
MSSCPACLTCVLASAKQPRPPGQIGRAANGRLSTAGMLSFVLVMHGQGSQRPNLLQLRRSKVAVMISEFESLLERA